MIFEITNDSDYTFELDGEWIPDGDFKTDRATPIAALATTRIEFSASVTGLRGVLWWVDNANHDVYLSVALSSPRIGNSTFVCHVGVPPANLKTDLGSAAKVEKDKAVANEGCEWSSTSDGIKLTIFSDVAHYAPHTAAEYSHDGMQSAPNTAGANDSNSAQGRWQGGKAGGRGGGYTNLAEGSTDVDAEKSQKSANDFLAQTRPKDASDGMVRGLCTAGQGIAGGFAAAVAMPVVGAKQEGALGFAKGLGLGIVSGAGMAIAGTACGVVQIGRGVAQAPGAQRARKEEKVWDQELGQWVDTDLCALEAQTAGDDEDGPSGGASSVKVVDTEFYDLLKVATNATPSDIKKAYYKEARLVHPDKNPDDEAATVKFQQLSQVYQVLSEPETRKKYDREGKAGIEGKTMELDPSTFFAMLFGSERFVPWTGELHAAMQADHFVKKTEEPQDDGAELFANGAPLKRRQLRREVQCAVHLREKLDRWVYGRDQEGFEELMRLEAHELGGAQFGHELLESLGLIYQVRSEIYLANELVGRFTLAKRVASAKHTGLLVKHNLHFYRNAAGSMWRAKGLYDKGKKASIVAAKQEKEGAVEEEKQKLKEEQSQQIEEAMTQALPTFLQTAWSYVARDIDYTMKQVSRKFLQDKSVPWQIRIRRAQALRRLGQIFSEEGARGAAEGGKTGSEEQQAQAKALLQEALVGSMREK